MNQYAIGGAVLLVLWVLLAFVFAIPSGWVHAPLALGCVLLARAVVGKRA
jgi:hypothetical protein